MTKLEIILTISTWIFVGCFICVKRNWFKHVTVGYNTFDKDMCNILTILFAPISLIVTIIKVYILDDWNNE